MGLVAFYSILIHLRSIMLQEVMWVFREIITWGSVCLKSSKNIGKESDFRGTFPMLRILQCSSGLCGEQGLEMKCFSHVTSFQLTDAWLGVGAGVSSSCWALMPGKGLGIAECRLTPSCCISFTLLRLDGDRGSASLLIPINTTWAKKLG